MKIAVLQKIVVDTYAIPQISNDETEIEWSSGTEWVNDRHSEFAIEEAVRVKEKLGGTIKTFSVRTGGHTKPILKALAKGIDEAVIIDHDDLYYSDPVSIARALADELEEYEPDLVIAGTESSDSNNFLVGPAVAAFLDIPILGELRKLEATEEGISGYRVVSGRREEYSASYPILITTHKALNHPRYPKIPEIMKAKRKPQQIKEELGFDLSEKISQIKVEKPTQERKQIMLEGSVDEQVEQLLDHLIQEHGVIEG